MSTAEHGTGLEETIDEIYDENGFNIWTRDARGIITRQFFDEATGAVRQIIDDADPAKLANPPAGWVVPSFGGTHAVTDVVNDRLGRAVRRIGPEHSAAIDEEGATGPCTASRVSAKLVRTVEYTVYLCPRHQTWRGQGYVSGFGSPEESWQLLGPVQIEQRNATGDAIDVIEAAPSCECGPLSVATFGELDPHSKLPKREHWTAWEQILRDLWAREIGRRSYLQIPSSGLGFQNEHYYETATGYDSLNRVIRAMSRDGTITRTVFNPTSDPAEMWIGTDDTGATVSDPGNGGADGNNMKLVAAHEYDDGNAGGNRNLTKTTRPVNDTAANDREVDTAYDWRNRPVEVRTNDGTTLFITTTAYDNLHNAISQTGYHTSTANANRISFAETSFDARQRPYEEKTHGVDPANGNLTNALTAGTWYDEDDNLIQETTAGQTGATKTDYDGLNLPVTTYQVVPGTPPAGAAANDVSDDIVVEQIESTFDQASNLIATTTRQRLADATGKGPLGEETGDQPRARVSSMAFYRDAIRRHRFEANYGTNGEAAFERPAAPPEATELVLVTETRYDQAGRAHEMIAPDGVVERKEFDTLGQTTRQIEACGTGEQRTQQFRWHPSGPMEFLILENPDTGQQVTQWFFGSSLDDSEVARNDVVIGKQYPTGESSRFTLNRQGEYQSETQPNGTTHQYDRNKLGQIIHDRVTALGADIDDSVLRVSTTFNNRGIEETITTYDNATVGSGAIVNQMKKEYDAFNQMISDAQEHDGAVDANTPEVTYSFSDGSNNTLRKTSVSTPAGHKVNYDYGAANSIADAFNRPASLKVDGETGNLVEYEFIGLVLNSKIKYPTPDTELNTSYDRFARIIDMPWTNAARTTTHAHIQYGYDAASRRTWRKDLTPHADDQHDRAYTYDALSQVKSAEVGALNLNESGISGVPEQSESWTYDETGNWLAYEKDEDGTTSIDQSRRHNESNQITVIDGNGSSINHDLNGNTTLLPTGDDLQDTPNKLKWNPWNMLVEVRDSSDDSLINAYQYDGRFRRTTVTESDGTITHAYYNDQWRQVEEREGTSADPAKVHYWGALNRWELVRRDRDANENGTLDESFYCIKDAMDPIAVLDSSGTIQERFEYTAFGTASFFGVNFGARNGSSIDWCFLFHGEFRDLDTEMYNYGFRYFDPTTGRWTKRDPVGELGESNLYRLVCNDPMKLLDFLGNTPEDLTNPEFVIITYYATVTWELAYDEASGICGPCPQTVGPATSDGHHTEIEALVDAESKLVVPDGCRKSGHEIKILELYGIFREKGPIPA